MLVWQIRKRHLLGNQATQLLESLPPLHWNKTVSNTSDIDQILSTVVADDQRIESVRSGHIAADHEFLTAIHSVFGPCASAFACLVSAILPFGHDAFELLLAHCCNDFICRDLKLIENAGWLARLEKLL